MQDARCNGIEIPAQEANLIEMGRLALRGAMVFDTFPKYPTHQRNGCLRMPVHLNINLQDA